MKQKKHATIPIFVPHLGCPHNCIFCNQKSITGVSEFDISNVEKEINCALKTITSNEKPEIAFFGGSFTGIEESLMISLLEIGRSYIEKGLISSMRCSTRPDYISDHILSILQYYGLKTIEIGVQSMSDNVLTESLRGHTAECTINAMQMIKNAGFNLVGQMMIGLPKSEPEDEIYCAKAIINAGASGARIYPTAVFEKTGLEALMLSEKYKPLTITDAVNRSANVAELFIDNHVKLLRIGLCESESLHSQNGIVAGAYHPALGEMCASEIYRRKIEKNLKEKYNATYKNAIIYIGSGNLSKAIGHKQSNKIYFYEKYNFNKIRFVEDDNLDDYELDVELK